MPEIKTDISKIQFSSTVYPTEADMKLWNSLSPAEQHAVVARDLDEAEKSGTATPESMEAMLQRVRGSQAHDL